MQDSQNGVKLQEPEAEQEAQSGFFGSATVQESVAEPETKQIDTLHLRRGPGGLSLAHGPAPVAPPVPDIPPPVEAPKESSTAAAPPAAKVAPSVQPAPPLQPKTAPPPPIPQSAPPRPVVFPADEPSSSGAGKIIGSIILVVLLLGGIAAFVVMKGLPMLGQRMLGDIEIDWVEMPAAPARPWPFVELNGIQGSGESGRAILSGELVAIGNRSRDGVEVAVIESGRVLLRFDGQERYLLVGDRTY